MKKLAEIADEVSQSFTDRAKRFAKASLSTKIVIAIGSAISGIAVFVTSSPLTTANYVGIGASFIILLSSLLSIFIDLDASTELNRARQAVERAQEAERDAESAMANVESLEIDQKRSIELYTAITSMRGVIERVLARPAEHTDVNKTIHTMIELSKRSLVIAMGLQMAEHYTLCVYRAEQDPTTHKFNLRCIAQTRSIEIDISQARIWASGVGVGGAAYARNGEIVVPNLGAIDIGTLYQPPVAKPKDAEQYRSIAAVPITLDGQEPWGVVVGTSDQVNHFVIRTDGIQTVEAVRAVAGMVALAVRAHEALAGQTKV